MASVVFDPRRGVYQVQYHDGRAWRRKTIHKLPNWKVGRTRPKSDPHEVTRALAAYKAGEATQGGRGRGAASGQPAAPVTLAGFLDAYRTFYAAAREPGSVIQFDSARRSFEGFCAYRKIVKLADVTPEVCQAWIEGRAGEISRKTGAPIEYATLAKERALLAAPWGRAVKQDRVAKNPWLGVEIPARPEKRKRGSWSPDEYRKLVAAAAPWLRDIVVVGCHSGLRIEALLGLEWRDVDLPGGSIAVRPELDKSHRGYDVPIHPAAREVFVRRKAAGASRPTDPVLTNRAGGKTVVQHVAGSIRRACKRAGLPDPDSPCHHARRTFGRWAVLGHLTGRPIPVYVIQRWLNHVSIKTTMIYLDIKTEESADWMSPPSGSPPATDANASDGQPEPEQ